MDYKPNSVIFSAEPKTRRSFIWAQRRRGARATYPSAPPKIDDRASNPALSLRIHLALLCGLAPHGVCQAFNVTVKAVSSYLAISPLPPYKTV